MNGCDKILVVQVAGLGYDFLCNNRGGELAGMRFKPLRSVFPAVTCTVQASFRTAASPDAHGIIANGLWDRGYAKARFWEQSAALVQGERIWQAYRRTGKKVAMLFWQQSMGEDVDLILTPAPLHKHHGGMIQDCYSRPAGLYRTICERTGRKFNLMHYWGPLASWKSSQWIAEATAAVISDNQHSPDLCLTYLPVLDYDLQRYGLNHPKSAKALAALERQLKLLRTAASANGYKLLIFGDYALENVAGAPLLPNLELRRSGLFQVRNIGGMEYPDFFTSAAFAMVDHAVAHIYLRDQSRQDEVRRVLESVDGVAEVLDCEGQQGYGIHHSRSGDLIAVAAPGRWFAYPWWKDKKCAPDFASHVDIHNKPGYDPAELFFGWPPGSVSMRPERVRGTHGRVAPGLETAWASDFIDDDCGSLEDLAAVLRRELLRP